MNFNKNWIVALLAIPLLFSGYCSAFLGSMTDKIGKDFRALTQRVTSRHILLPRNTDLALALKQKIRNQTQIEGEDTYVVDTFELAAQKYSRDNTTNFRGGLIGELVPQGYCMSPELDKACFEVRLGVVEGPIETEFGYHLLLVSERINCPKLDGPNTKLVPGPNGGTLVPSRQRSPAEKAKFVFDQVVFWIFGIFAGGLVAEGAARLTDIPDVTAL